jgi:hypothetical protein
MSSEETHKVKRKKVIVIGYAYWAKELAETLCRAGFDAEHLLVEKEYVPVIYRWCQAARRIVYPLLSRLFRKSFAIHIVGTVRMRILCRLGRLFGKRVFLHWIGTDVLRFCQAVKGGDNHLLRFYQKIPHAHFTVSPHLIGELAEFGIKAELFPLITKKIIPEKIIPMPDKPAVLSYWPHERRDFYNGDILDALAEEFPKVIFYIVTSDGKDEPQHANMKYLGRMDDIDEVYCKASILVRMPQHDGMPGMVLEMLARGRCVIWNQHFPYTEYAGNLEQARKVLRECLERTDSNEAGREYVLENFSPEKIVERMKPKYYKALEG